MMHGQKNIKLRNSSLYFFCTWRRKSSSIWTWT